MKPLVEAVKYRVFKAYPAIIREGAFDKVDEMILTPWLLGGMADVVPMGTWEWIKSMQVARRRKALITAWAKRTERGERDSQFHIVKPFVKTENLPWFGITDGMPDVTACTYVARLIQAPHDETHLIAGPWLKPLTRALKERWDVNNWIFYASVCPEKLDRWLRRNQHSSSFFWSDYSAFDATWSKRAWRTVERFYRHLMPHAPEEFWEVLEIWRKPQGKAVFRREGAKVTYKSQEMMLSGRDDTALANAILNGLAIATSFAAALAGKSIEDLTLQDINRASELVRIAIVGDDSLVCCDFDVEPYVPAILAGIESFGLVAKAGHSRHLHDVTFLGCMPYPTRSGLFWGPTIGRRLYKAFWQCERGEHLPAWTHGVAVQMALWKCVPVLADLGERVCSLLSGTPVNPHADEQKSWHTRTSETARWDDLTVEWLTRRYPALNRDMVCRDVERIADIRRLPCIMHCETFLACVAQDEL